MGFDLSCVIVGHRERRLCVPSLRSFAAAIACARAAGHSVEALGVLDRPDKLTQELFTRFLEGEANVQVVDFGDQGLTRNYAVGAARGRMTAFLDADDLWSEDWLVRGLDFLASAPAGTIAHPEFNYMFGASRDVYHHIDQTSDAFSTDMLRVANYWDALCLCETEVYRRIPFQPRDIAGGWAYEDWRWNCDTVAAGLVHRIVPGTILFKRRRAGSQTMQAFGTSALPARSALHDYGHALHRRGR